MFFPFPVTGAGGLHDEVDQVGGILGFLFGGAARTVLLAVLEVEPEQRKRRAEEKQ